MTPTTEEQQLIDLLQQSMKDLKESQDLETVRQAGSTILMFSFYQLANKPDTNGDN